MNRMKVRGAGSKLERSQKVLTEVFGSIRFSKSVEEMMKEDDKLLYDV